MLVPLQERDADRQLQQSEPSLVIGAKKKIIVISIIATAAASLSIEVFQERQVTRIFS